MGCGCSESPQISQIHQFSQVGAGKGNNNMSKQTGIKESMPKDNGKEKKKKNKNKNKNKKYLVVDDLAFELMEHPIYIPIPSEVINIKDTNKQTQALQNFTLRVYKDLMKLDYFDWFHDHRSIIIDGFSVRHNKIYPSIST